MCITVLHCPWERNHIPDIPHTGQIHDTPFKPKAKEFEYKVFWGCDLQTEHERFLTEKEFKRPVFVTDYPKEIKAFYINT